jgi:hypothetical protein
MALPLLNAGSSSLKWSVMDPDGCLVSAQGSMDWASSRPATRGRWERPRLLPRRAGREDLERTAGLVIQRKPNPGKEAMPAHRHHWTED